MRGFQDTTYLLPVIGIEINLLQDLFGRLLLSDHFFVINELSIFELFGKVSRFMTRDKKAEKRFYIGMKSILSS